MKTFFKVIVSIIALVVTALIVIMLVADHKKLKILENESEKMYEPELTTLNFPLLISMNDIEKLANAKIKPVLVDKRIPMKNGSDTLTLKVTRLGDLNFELNNKFFNSSIPLKLEVQFSKKIIGKKNVQLFKKEPLTLFISAKFRSAIDLQQNMTIKCKTELTEIQWNEEPNIKVLGIQFNLKEKINELMMEKAPEITANIDAQMATKINLKKPMMKIWNNIQKSIPASKDQKDLFLRIQPQGLSVHVDKSLNDSLKLDLGVTSKIYVRFAADTAEIAKVAFPSKIRIARKMKDDMSHLQLHILFPLDRLNQIIREKLQGKTFDVKGLSVRIKKIQVINGTRNIYVRIKHGGDITGQILVKGMPKLSADKQVISVENVSFENQLDDEVFNSMTDLLHAQILSLLKDNVHFDVGSVLGSIPTYARKAIDKSKLAKKADIALNHLEVENLKIELTKRNIQLIVSGQSSFEVALKKESFKILKKKK